MTDLERARMRVLHAEAQFNEVKGPSFKFRVPAQELHEAREELHRLESKERARHD